MALIKFVLQSKHRLFEIGAKQDLSRMQVVTLLLLDGPRPMSNFKNVFNCDASNVTGIVDGLEQKGLVVRFDPQKDRRVKMVKLTPKGRRWRSSLISEFTTGSDHLLAKLSPKEAKSFIAMVRKITSD